MSIKMSTSKVVYECALDEFICDYDGRCLFVDDEKYNRYGSCYGSRRGEKCPFFGMDPKNSKVKIIVTEEFEV